MTELEQLKREITDKGLKEILRWVLEKFGPEKVVLASSFSLEDQVITHALVKINPKARIFTLDTGRLFQETYEVMQKTMDRYRIHYEVLFPATKEVEALVSETGPNSMYNSLSLRLKCCEIRKVKPLRRILATADAWICGLRREQGITRQEVEVIDWDKQFNIYKISPLAAWSEEELWRYIKDNAVPYNTLYDKGFRSIGCAPCTRPTKPEEDLRAGRWWWENPEHRECGLHKR